MRQRVLDILVARFAYGGNGSVAMELPCIADWMFDLATKCAKDVRIGRIGRTTLSDTPVTMTRNKAVKMAQEGKFDVLLMIDSDQQPDCEPDGKPFWDTSFDFLYKNWDRGPSVIVAPYCGPPPIENIYVFEWQLTQNNPTPCFKLVGMERNDASRWVGIAECAAGPTGLSMWDVRAFDLITQPYFAYEWEGPAQSEKVGTEDVYCTRNVSLAGIEKLGYNPLYCNWDAWAGHAKPKLVRKPRYITADQIHASLKDAVQRGHSANSAMEMRGEPGTYSPELYNACRNPQGKVTLDLSDSASAAIEPRPEYEFSVVAAQDCAPDRTNGFAEVVQD